MIHMTQQYYQSLGLAWWENNSWTFESNICVRLII